MPAALSRESLRWAQVSRPRPAPDRRSPSTTRSTLAAHSGETSVATVRGREPRAQQGHCQQNSSRVRIANRPALWARRCLSLERFPRSHESIEHRRPDELNTREVSRLREFRASRGEISLLFAHTASVPVRQKALSFSQNSLATCTSEWIALWCNAGRVLVCATGSASALMVRKTLAKPVAHNTSPTHSKSTRPSTTA